MIKNILTTISVFALLSIIVIGAVSASPNRQQSETGPLRFLIAVLNDASDKGTLTDALSTLLSDLLIEHLIIPATGETPAQVRERLTTTPLPLRLGPPREHWASSSSPSRTYLEVLDWAQRSLTDAMHYWGVGEVPMKDGHARRGRAHAGRILGTRF